MIRLLLLCYFIHFVACSEIESKVIDVQGHRGCRGLYPENTIIGFKKAIELGVTTLELDIVVNKDLDLIVSHDPYYHAEITTLNDGTHLKPNQEQNWIIYNLIFEEMKLLDVGLRQSKRFPRQKSVSAIKPTLKEVFETFSLTDIRYNIEIKRKPSEEGVLYPELSLYIDLVVNLIREYNLSKKVTIQSFDIETLQMIKKRYPSYQLAFLTDDKINDFADNVELLGFVPDIYSPHRTLVTIPLIHLCHKKNIKIIPWTVNYPSTMRKLIRWGVDGIITDYPDKLINILNK
ncbi:MAG: glycerophosphodiester phosphodiesterase family protein [Saprospiraceae bacterium]